METRTVAAILIAYALGCFCAAYYLVRYRTGQDIRDLGSGTAGAKNAGLILGAWAFGVVMAGDIAKGILAMIIGLALGLTGWALDFVYLAVIIGHLYPAQLGFRGGKGVAVAYGGLLVLSPPLAAAALGIAAVMFAVTRAFTLSGLIAIAAAPLAGGLLGLSPQLLAGIATAAVLLLFAHRDNIRKLAQRRRT